MPIDPSQFPTSEGEIQANRHADFDRRLRALEYGTYFPASGRESYVDAAELIASGSGALLDRNGPELKFENVKIGARILVAFNAEISNPAASVTSLIYLVGLGAVGSAETSTVDLGAGPVPGFGDQIISTNGVWYSTHAGFSAVPGSGIGSTLNGGILIYRAVQSSVSFKLYYGALGAGGLGNASFRKRRLWASIFNPSS